MPHVELPQAEFKVVMLGDTFTGKTSLVLRFAEGHYRDSARSATVGAFFITKRLTVQGLTCKIQIWDTAGQEQFKKLAPMYYKNAAAAIVCYDMDSPKSFETLKFWMDELQQNVPAGSIVLAMCATKSDLAPNADTGPAEALAQETGAMFLKTSAKDNTNVTQLFEKVAERVLQFQKQAGSGCGIPVRLATTAIETPTKNVLSNGSTSTPGVEGRPAHSQSGMASIPETGRAKSPHCREEKKGEEEDDVLHASQSRESSKDPINTRCDANMLMCGDVLDSGGGSGCVMS